MWTIKNKCFYLNHLANCPCVFTHVQYAARRWLTTVSCVGISYKYCIQALLQPQFSLADNGWWCACTECSAVAQAAAKTSPGPKKSTLYPTPSFSLSSVHSLWCALSCRRLSTAGPLCMPWKLSNEIPKYFLTNVIFFLSGSKGLFDVLRRVFTAKKTSGMSLKFYFLQL